MNGEALRDLHAYGGLFLVGLGVWWQFGPIALAVVGGALFFLALRGQ